jgi:hypothetical protein
MSDNVRTLRSRMSVFPLRHHHTAVTTLVLRQRNGVPYEIERVSCQGCKKLLAERPVRRAAA